MRFGPGLSVHSMMDRRFAPLTFKGWEDADLHGDQAKTWFDAMVNHQVNMGTTLDLLWLAKMGVEAALHDTDRRYIAPMALARQRSLAEHIGERPDWDMFPGFEPSLGARALEKHQEVTRILHEAGGIVVGGTDCGGIAYPPAGLACCGKSSSCPKPSAPWPRSRRSRLWRPAICASRTISAAWRRAVTPTCSSSTVTRSPTRGSCGG